MYSCYYTDMTQKSKYNFKKKGKKGKTQKEEKQKKRKTQEKTTYVYKNNKTNQHNY